MKRIGLRIFGICIIFNCQAGNENPPLGARSAAMANASVTLQDAWCASQNQAGLGFVRDIAAGIYYENRFLLNQLAIKGGVFALPVKGGTFGLCFSNFGYSSFHENKYSLSFAKTFGEKLSAGIAMNYMSTRIAEGYGYKGVLVGEMGIQSKPLKGLTLGLHLFNPTRTKIASYNEERIPTIIRFGADYYFSDKVTLALETEKDMAQKAIIKAGIEYKPVKEFYLRIGIATNPTLSSFGIGINLNQTKIDVAASYHQTLGFSPQLGLTYIFKKSEAAAL